MKKRCAGSPSGPSLDFDDDFATLLVQEFLGHRHRLIGGRGGATARNFESVSCEDGFALIFVKSCHGQSSMILARFPGSARNASPARTSPAAERVLESGDFLLCVRTQELDCDDLTDAK